MKWFFSQNSNILTAGDMVLLRADHQDDDMWVLYDVHGFIMCCSLDKLNGHLQKNGIPTILFTKEEITYAKA